MDRDLTIMIYGALMGVAGSILTSTCPQMRM